MAIRIVFLVPKLNASGGVEKLITEFVNWLKNNTDSSVTVVKLNAGPNAFPFCDGIKVLSYKCSGAGKIRNFFGRLKFCRNVFDDLRPDIIYCTYPKPILFARLARPKGCRIIGSEHSVPKYRGRFEERLRYISSRLCDGFIFQTNAVRQDFPRVTRDKSIVIPNAASVKSVAGPVRKEKLIVSMGRLEKVKGFDDLILACSQFLRNHPRYKLVILGEGSEKKNMEQLIRKLQLQDNVSLAGNISNPEKIISRAELFVVTSRYEGFSNAIIEAMAVGTCCVSYDCDYGPRSIIKDGKTGVLVAQNNPKLLGETIENLVLDKEKRFEIEKSALVESANYVPDVVFRKYYTYFKKIGGK